MFIWVIFLGIPLALSRGRHVGIEMLEHAMPLLAPGGLLVYSTCSLEPEENEAAVAKLPVVSTHLRLPGRDPGDGFFAAVISLPQ